MMKDPTLRQYLAAHAPAQPQSWFQPTMPNECPKPVWKNASDRTDDRPADNAAVIEAWYVERDKQRHVQWPWAWADGVISSENK